MTPSERLHEIHREAYGSLVATLARRTRDLALAEDAVQEAFTRALARWPDDEPERPIAWLARAARNAAIDRLRRDRLHGERVAELEHRTAFETDTPVDPLEHPALRDDLLRLVFACCHPALRIEARVALCLRAVCGLETRDIARALIVPEATLAQRLVRAKQKLAGAGIGFRVPEEDELAPRLASVLAVIYLIFNEGYLAARGDAPMREALAERAIELGRTLQRALPREPEAAALLALMLLQHARRAARFDAAGRLVTLPDQDRGLWDADAIAEGRALVGHVFDVGAGESVYALQAAIAATHAVAPTPDATDWAQIALLYTHLTKLDPSPVVALNRAVAVAERSGAEAGLAELDPLRESVTLQRYYLYHATRGDLLRRCGRLADAAASYRRAIELAENASERAFLEGRLDEVESSGSD